MPIYEYRCTSCGHEKEVLQKMSDTPLTECPACGKPTLTKLISAAGFQLKGSGWYATDFKGGAKSAKPAKDGDGPKADGKSGDDGKSAASSGSAGESPAKGGDKREESKPKEEAKPDKPVSTGASPAGQ